MLLEEPLVQRAIESSAPELAPFYQEAQTAARQRLPHIPLPSRRDETWRFGNRMAYRFETAPEWAPASVVQADELIELSEELAENAGKAVFANGLSLSFELSEGLRAQGVIWLPLNEAAAQHPELFRRYFQVQGAPLGSEYYAALHMAQGPVGSFLYVPKNVEIALPLECFQWHCGPDGAVYPHTLIVAERHSSVTFIEYQRSLDQSAAGYVGAVTDLHIGEGAKVNYVTIQQWGAAMTTHQINSTEVARDGAAKSLTVNLGGLNVRGEHFSRLTGAGGRSDMLCITTAEGEQVFDLRTLQEHQAPNTYSDLLYKNTLNGESKTVFSGLIKVDPGAHGTDAYQKVRNLLLDERAEADSMPGLEILADEVKCSHGATTGQIDAEELFYLQARGIPAEMAKRLMVGGFLQEAAQRLELPVIEAHVAKLVEEHFAS